MKQTLYIGMFTALLAAGCGSTTRTTEQARIQTHSEATAQAAQDTGQGLGGMVRNTADTLGNAAETAGHATVYGVREAGQTLTGNQGNPNAEAASARSRANMERNAQETSQAARRVTGSTEQTGRAAATTTYQAGATTVDSARYGVNEVRRSASDEPREQVTTTTVTTVTRYPDGRVVRRTRRTSVGGGPVVNTHSANPPPSTVPQR